jgi:hypothetical protein
VNERHQPDMAALLVSEPTSKSGVWRRFPSPQCRAAGCSEAAVVCSEIQHGQTEPAPTCCKRPKGYASEGQSQGYACVICLPSVSVNIALSGYHTDAGRGRPYALTGHNQHGRLARSPKTHHCRNPLGPDNVLGRRLLPIRKTRICPRGAKY